mgnify:CR=1 FL=1
MSLDNAILRDVNSITSKPGQAKGSRIVCGRNTSDNRTTGLPGAEEVAEETLLGVPGVVLCLHGNGPVTVGPGDLGVGGAEGLNPLV